jgi:hypothetical protein
MNWHRVTHKVLMMPYNKLIHTDTSMTSLLQQYILEDFVKCRMQND